MAESTSRQYRLKGRAVIRISRSDAPHTNAVNDDSPTAFLQRLVTNDVDAKLPKYAALLTPQGKTAFDFIVWSVSSGLGSEHGAQGDLLLDCEAASAEALCAKLRQYRLRAPLTIAIDEGLSVGWIASITNNQAKKPTVCAPDPRLAALGTRCIIPKADANSLPIGDAQWLAHRLSHGIAEGHEELGDILWLETNADLLNGVAFDKGCYIGQENTARMHWRGKVNRRLVIVPLGQSDPERQKSVWPVLGLALDHLRIADISTPPKWMAAALRP